MEEFVNIEEPQERKRPIRLTVLCVLTFIFSGLGAFASFFIPLFPEEMINAFKDSPQYKDDELTAQMFTIINAGWTYHFPTLICALGSLIGAILMWKLKKIGFHFYALSNLALLFIPTLVLKENISWSAIFLTVGFIGMYGLNMKSFK